MHLEFISVQFFGRHNDTVPSVIQSSGEERGEFYEFRNSPLKKRLPYAFKGAKNNASMESSGKTANRSSYPD